MEPERRYRSLPLALKRASRITCSWCLPAVKIAGVPYGDCFERGGYVRLRQLGAGSSAKVFEAEHRETGERVAVKVVRKARLPRDGGGDARASPASEIAVLRALAGSEHVIRLLGARQTRAKIQLVLELVEGGELFDRLAARERFVEADARRVVRALLSAVGHVHASGFAHRDLKPENVLMRSARGSDCALVLADFGFAACCGEGRGELRGLVGSPQFVAPEVLEGLPYGRGVDVWALGVITYIVLSGYAPFFGADRAQMYGRVRRGEWSFHHDCWRHVPSDARALVRDMLTLEPARRATCAELLARAWVDLCDDDAAEGVDLSASPRNLRRARSSRAAPTRGERGAPPTSPRGETAFDFSDPMSAPAAARQNGRKLAFDDEHGGDEDPRHVSRKLAFAEEDEGASDIELETGCLMQCLAPGTAAGA